MKKIIDENGKIFKKVNIIDFFVVAVVIVLALSAFLKFGKAGETLSSDKTIEYTINVKQVRQYSVDALDDNLLGIKENDTKKELGDIINIKVTPAKEQVKLIDGSYKEVELKEYYDALLTVRVKGTETNDNYYTNTGRKLIVGEEIVINNDYVGVQGVVASVEVIDDK